MRKIIKNETMICIFLSGILPLLIFLLATGISEMLPGQRYNFLYGDAISQYSLFPRAFFRRLFNGEDLIYSFRNGLGSPTVALNAFYSMSPFNAIYAIISNMEIAGLFVVCLKLICTALSMCILLRAVVKTNIETTVFLSTAYALCSFFSAFYVAIALLDMLYVLPILVLLIVRFVKQGKWGALCLMYSYSFIIQFYTAYMTGIFSAVIYLTYAWYCYGRSFQKWKKSIKSYMICVLLAAMIAMPLLLPTIFELFSMHNSDVEDIHDISILLHNILVGLFPVQTQITYNTFPLMYAGLPVLLLSTAFFVNGKREGREKILGIIPISFLALCLMIKPLFLFMHAFDMPTGYTFRFSWMVNFCMILLSAREVADSDHEEESQIKKWMIGAGWILIFLILYVLCGSKPVEDYSINRGAVLIVACLITFYTLMLCQKQVKGWVGIIYGVLLLCELFAGVVQRQIYIKKSTPERSYYDICEQEAETSMEMVKKEEETDPWPFYRISYNNAYSDNVSALYEYNGLGWFSSVENTAVRNVLKNFGYYTSPLLVSDYGSTPLMQMLLAQKYRVECGFFLGRHPYDFTFRKNEKTLPLGYMVSDAIEEYTSQGLDPFDAQNGLVSAMCGKEYGIYEQQDTYGIELEGVYLECREEGYRLQFQGKLGMAVYSFEAKNNSTVYAYMGRWGISEKHEEYPQIFSNVDVGVMTSWSKMGTPHIIPIRRDDDGYIRLIVSYEPKRENEIFDYEYLHFAYENAEEIERAYKELSANRLEISSFRDERISGKVQVEPQKRLLFTSIPYDENWKVYVDGTKGETIAVLDGAFIGVRLAEGEHEIVFAYENKWAEYGRILGAFGMIIFMLITFYEKKRVMDETIGEKNKSIDTNVTE